MYPIYGCVLFIPFFIPSAKNTAFLIMLQTQIMQCFCLNEMNTYLLHCIQRPVIISTFIFIHLADAFIQSDLQLRNIIRDTL